ncbi:UNVERIFIED_ORG: hypothetical protein J2W87_001250 [Pseudomonas putida]|nr:hypothetical protein [Pseudomonas putida]
MQPIQFFAARAEDGALVPGATVDVFVSGTQTRAALFLDSLGNIPLGNPFLADKNARVFFYTSTNRIDVHIHRGGYSAPLIRDIVVTDPDDVLALTNGVYRSVAQGLAATTSGKIFQVLAPEDEAAYAIYENVNGVAVDTGKRIPTRYLLDRVEHSAQQYADNAEAFSEASRIFAEGAMAYAGRNFGPLTADPVTNPLGQPLAAGDRYFNTALDIERVYSGIVWLTPNADGQQIQQYLADPGNGPRMIAWGAGIDLRTKISKDIPSILDYNGHDITGNNDTTAELQEFLNDYKDFVKSGSASYTGGVKANLPKGILAISSRIKLWPLITLSGAGPFSTIIKAANTWTDGEYMVSASPELDGYEIIRPAVGMRDLGFDHMNTGARGFIGHALNDNCVFSNIRSFNFRKNILTLDRGVGGGTVSQGWTCRDWQAITRYDIEEDVFVTMEANEGMFIACKALGLSIGASAATGFHIGKGKISEGVHVFGSSAAHLPNGIGVRFNNARDCTAQKNTFENILHDIHIGHDSDFFKCSKIEARGNRHYPTVGAPATQRDIYMDKCLSVIAETRENGVIEVTAGANNSQVILPTNRTSGTDLPSTVTLNSPTTVVMETHKNGVAVHHKNGSVDTNLGTSGQCDLKLPGGGFLRGDVFNTTVVAAAGKGARLLANGGSVAVNATGDITLSSAAGRPVTLQENGVNKIQLDGSGRVRIFDLSTDVPGVPNAVFKDTGGFLKIT